MLFARFELFRSLLFCCGLILRGDTTGGQLSELSVLLALVILPLISITHKFRE